MLAAVAVGARVRVEAGRAQHRVLARHLLQRPLAVHDRVPDLAGPAVPAVEAHAVQHERRADADLAGHVQERRGAAVRAARVRLGLGREVGLVRELRGVLAEHRRGRQQADDVDLAPAEVGREQQRAGRAVDEAGQRERGADDARGGLRRRHLLDELVDEPREQPQDGARVGAAEVARELALPQHGAGQVDDARPEVVDVHLRPDGRERAGRCGERHRRPAGAHRGGGRQLGDEPGLDQAVDERRDGGAGQPGGGGDVGAGRWTGADRRGVEHVPEHELEVVLAQGPLAGGGGAHGLDPSAHPL